MATQQQGTFEILLNPSVEEKDVLRLSNQAQKIYGLLLKGPVRTTQLVSVACQYCARLNELRHALVRVGMMVDEQKGKDGNNKYEIVSLDVSTFWRKVKQKSEEWKWV